jgi:hypothetical protein
VTQGAGKRGRDYPVREKSANGVPKPEESVERTCYRCGASFLKLAPGATGERGIWRNWEWFCSEECLSRPQGWPV